MVFFVVGAVGSSIVAVAPESDRRRRRRSGNNNRVRQTGTRLGYMVFTYGPISILYSSSSSSFPFYLREEELLHFFALLLFFRPAVRLTLWGALYGAVSALQQHPVLLVKLWHQSPSFSLLPCRPLLKICCLYKTEYRRGGYKKNKKKKERNWRNKYLIESRTTVTILSE